jgi:hypothetical protein
MPCLTMPSLAFPFLHLPLALPFLHFPCHTLQNPNSLTGNRKPSAKTMCRKPPNIMWSRKYVVPEICRPGDNMSARNRRKYVGPKFFFRALPPNPRAGGSAPLHPPRGGLAAPPLTPPRPQALRHYYSCKEYNTYPTFSHLLFSLHTGGYRVT